ncbi:hypothetical protein [Peribacillus acanthi]|uniref:hypothetical protein n=1 Tax=Peribacillus acanthi TaxID=2171554 RepID=UPI000D3E9530|nr:hypothetical protein [Peribacillus acanthi]
MKKSDVLVADIVIYAMKQIQMAKLDKKLTGDIEYWNGEIMSMKYLLLYIDKLLGKRKTNETTLPELSILFQRVDSNRKERFDYFSSKIWEDELDEE